ncbi:cysteine proteinase [Aureobasidium sp. EXF-10727]|nr:cysteine proteinase [Aureobasidium sp. EXF-10727]KAI4723840.1 cysteine proteinase [Aureobasidium sp. EXF-10728]
MTQRTYSKTFTPLESNPEIFTSLAHTLGLCSSLTFHEIYSLDEQCISGRILAYTLAFPTSESYDEQRAAEIPKLKGVDKDDISASKVEQGQEQEQDQGVFWVRQTIHNACGLYALLHAACNGSARTFIPNKTKEPNSILDKLIKTPPNQQSNFLDTNAHLEKLYADAANQGDTLPPENGVEVDWHYTCFAPSFDAHKLYELDGDRWGPLYRADLLPDSADFDAKAIGLIREYFERETGDKEIQFNVMALVDESSSR